jgi:hypothetical protein
MRNIKNISCFFRFVPDQINNQEVVCESAEIFVFVSDLATDPNGVKRYQWIATFFSIIGCEQRVTKKILPPARRFNVMRSVQEEGGLWIIELNQYLIFLNTLSTPLDVLSNHSTHDIQFQPISTGSLSKKSFPAAFQCRFKKNIFNRFRYGYCSQWDRHQKTMFRTGYILEKYHIQWCLNTCSCIMKEQGKNKDDFFLIYDLNIQFIMAHGCIRLFLKRHFI